MESLSEIFNNITISLNLNANFTNILLLKSINPFHKKQKQLMNTTTKDNDDIVLSTNETVPNQNDTKVNKEEYNNLKLNFLKNNCSVLSSKQKSIAKKTSTFLFIPSIIYPKFLLKSKESSYIRFKNNECKTK